MLQIKDDIFKQSQTNLLNNSDLNEKVYHQSLILKFAEFNHINM